MQSVCLIVGQDRDEQKNMSDNKDEPRFISASYAMNALEMLLQNYVLIGAIGNKQLSELSME
jgi:hypothetical protein